MISCSLKPFLLICLMISASHAKGILDTPRNDFQQVVVPDCCSAQAFPVLGAEPTVPTTLEKPPLNWSADVPAPKVIGHTLHIFKTILRPQWFRQMLVVPYLQRYIRTFQAPVLETVHIQREIPF